MTTPITLSSVPTAKRTKTSATCSPGPAHMQIRSSNESELLLRAFPRYTILVRATLLLILMFFVVPSWCHNQSPPAHHHLTVCITSIPLDDKKRMSMWRCDKKTWGRVAYTYLQLYVYFITEYFITRLFHACEMWVSIVHSVGLLSHYNPRTYAALDTTCTTCANGCMGTFYGDECFCCFRQLRMRLYEAWASIGLR